MVRPRFVVSLSLSRSLSLSLSLALSFSLSLPLLLIFVVFSCFVSPVVVEKLVSTDLYLKYRCSTVDRVDAVRRRRWARGWRTPTRQNMQPGAIVCPVSTVASFCASEAEKTKTRSADRPRVPDSVFGSAPVCGLSLSPFIFHSLFLSLYLSFPLFLSLSLDDSDNLGLIVSFLSVVMSIMSIKSS